MITCQKNTSHDAGAAPEEGGTLMKGGVVTTAAAADSTEANNETDTTTETTSAKVVYERNDLAHSILTQIYWETQEANKLFGALKDENSLIDDIDVRTAIRDRILRLQKGYSSANGWRVVVDQDELCSAFDIFQLQIKCRYVSLGLRIALEKMPAWNWKKCLKEAMQRIFETDGVVHVKSPETVRVWHSQFRLHNEIFPNPQVVRKNGTKKVPPAPDQNSSGNC